MDKGQQLIILKADLQMMTAANDEYLNQLLDSASEMIKREGIEEEDSVEYEMIVIHYAAYLFRRRAGAETAMPRYLRYELNNLLFHQKGAAQDDL